LVATAVALVLPFLQPVTGSGDDFMRTLLTGIFALVAVSNLVITRAIVLPSIFNAFQGGSVQRISTLPALRTNVHLAALTFSAAPSIYGLVLNVVWDEPWPVLLFSAFAVLGLAVTSSYVSGRLRTLELAERTRGGP
jgi:hypothetical protein